MNRLVGISSIIFAVFAWNGATAQPHSVPIGELTDSMRLHPKHALILISTDWCTFCRMQKAQLRKNDDFKKAVPYLYFAELDAGHNEDISFNGTTYSFKATGHGTGSHELAYVLGETGNRLAFPTWVLLNENFEIIFKFPGVIKAGELSQLLETIPRHSTPK
ncbi:thioredoxin family protein [Parapedobacter sp. 2B3]|uniref:thioredoxin family protein n=1 Tax=Parapedobacter sp. 2B3 TaxID=3342381 RepID=UPI0035B69258